MVKRIGIGAMVPALLAAWAGPTPGRAAESDLKPKYEAGAMSYYIRTVSKTENVSIGEGQEMPESHFNSEVGMRFKVLDAKPDGSATLECTLLYLDRAEVVGDQVFTFDSRSPGKTKAAPWATKVREFLNKPFKLTINAEGKVTAVEGMPDTAKSQFNRFEDIASEQTFKELAILATSGAGAGKTGAAWSGQLENPFGMSTSRLVEAREYQVDKLNGSVEVGFKSKITAKEDEQAAKDGKARIRVEFKSGAREGRFTWDKDKGQLIDYRSELRLEFTQFMPGAETTPMSTQHKIAETMKRAALEDFKLATKPERKKEEPKDEKDKPKEPAPEPEPEPKPGKSPDEKPEEEKPE